MEFEPLNFFPSFCSTLHQDDEINAQIHLDKHQSQESHSTNHEEDNDSSSYTAHSSKKPVVSIASENHNMVKQLVITIKQMVGKYIQDIGCSHLSREIIKNVWKHFQKIRTPSKEILKAMFNKEINKKLIEKLGLGHLLIKYGSYEYLNAMEDLRMEIIFRMRGESLRQHLMGRTIQKRERLAAYVQYFVEEQLRHGKISSRFSEAATKRMEDILETNRTQLECIDCYFQDANEAFVRFAS